jgi:hypothetical protein
MVLLLLLGHKFQRNFEELKAKSRETLVEAVEAYEEALLNESGEKNHKPNVTEGRLGSGRRKTVVTIAGAITSWPAEERRIQKEYSTGYV